jgi:hypothetical protein
MFFKVPMEFVTTAVSAVSGLRWCIELNVGRWPHIFFNDCSEYMAQLLGLR